MRYIGRRQGSILLFISLCIWGGAIAASPTVGSNTPQSRVLRATLENGLRVVIVPDPLAPVVTTEVNYLVGANETPAGFPGMAHAQEHMMFRGSPGLSAAQLADLGAAMGGRFNAETGQTITRYEFTVPAQDLDVALHIEAIRMRGVLDSKALWQLERGAIEQEVASDLSNPGYVLYTKILQALFQGTPYAHDGLGTRPSFKATTAAMLEQFHTKWYAPNNAILVIAGSVEPAKALSRIKQLFGDIPAKELPERPAIHLQPVLAQTIRMATDQPTGTAMLVFRMPGLHNRDFAAAQVLADVLSNHRGDLYGLVPAGKALSAGFDLLMHPEAGIGFAAAEFSAGDDAETLVSEIRGIIRKIVSEGVPGDQVEAAKRQERTEAELRKTSVPGLANLWSNTLAVGGRHSPQERIHAIESVTLADVNRVAREYLNPKHAVVGILSPQASAAPSTAAGGLGGFRGEESFAPRHPRKVELPAWAHEATQRLTIPSSTVNPIVSHLANGIELIVQPESISDTVSVLGRIRNHPSVEEPPDQEGVDTVLDNLFEYGSTHLDRLAFQKALDAIGAQESAGTDFSLQVLAEHFDRGVELLAQNEIHPAMPESAFHTVRRQVAASARGRLHSPGHLAQQALKAALFPPDDPTLRETTPKTVSSLTRDDVRAYYRKAYRPDLTTIVVIGKVDPGKAKQVIEKYFGSWSTSGAKPETELPEVPLNKAASSAVPDPSRVQDSVMLAQTLGLTRDNPDYYALQLGNHVLGGAFYATRLYQDLRERTGLVYYVGSSLDVGKTRGIYSVDYGCDPDKVSRAREIVVQALQRMRTQPVSDHELHQAKALLLRQIPLSEASIDDIADGLLQRAALDLPLDEPIRAAHRYMGLTAADVQKAFANYIRPGALVQITQGPPPR